jgi:hypothetical protein
VGLLIRSDAHLMFRKENPIVFQSKVLEVTVPFFRERSFAFAMNECDPATQQSPFEHPQGRQVNFQFFRGSCDGHSTRSR